MPYLLCLSAAFIAAFSVYALRLKKAETAAVTLLFSVVLGLIFSKLFYVLLLFNRTLGSRGLSALLRFRADEFSFFGAGVGVCAGVILSARFKVYPFILPPHWPVNFPGQLAVKIPGKIKSSLMPAATLIFSCGTIF